MRAVLQRVARGSVQVDSLLVGSIEQGLVVLLGVGAGDTVEDARQIAEKIVNLRIFSDESGRFQYSLRDVGGGVLVVSQFTLYGDCRRGRRPDFTAAARPAEAFALYDEFVAILRGMSIQVETGVFGAHMLVSIDNDGPVTLIIDSRG